METGQWSGWSRWAPFHCGWSPSRRNSRRLDWRNCRRWRGVENEISPCSYGKLTLVLAPNRSPRLVVDSSISGVTAHTCIPNHVCYPVTPRLWCYFCSTWPPSFTAVYLTHPGRCQSPSKNQNPPWWWRTSLLPFPEPTVPLSDIELWGQSLWLLLESVAGMLMRVLHRIVHVRHSMFIIFIWTTCWQHWILLLLQYMGLWLLLCACALESLWVGRKPNYNLKLYRLVGRSPLYIGQLP